MNLSAKVKSFVIKADTEKEAYIKGCKQLARFMASKKYTNLTFKIERTEIPNEFIFTMYTNIDLSEEQRKFCQLCKEYHCSFYVNEEYNCSRCNLKNFLSRARSRTEISKNFYKKEM